MLFLLVVMCSVWHKLRVDEDSVRRVRCVRVTVAHAPCRKSIKALFILIPLLGVNYMLMLIQPQEPAWLKLVFNYYSCIVSSTQGSLVAVMFCFRNAEVRLAHWHVVGRCVNASARRAAACGDDSARFSAARASEHPRT